MWKHAFFTVNKDLLFHKPFENFKHRKDLINERISKKILKHSA